MIRLHTIHLSVLVRCQQPTRQSPCPFPSLFPSPLSVSFYLRHLLSVTIRCLFPPVSPCCQITIVLLWIRFAEFVLLNSFCWIRFAEFVFADFVLLNSFLLNSNEFSNLLNRRIQQFLETEKCARAFWKVLLFIKIKKTRVPRVFY